MAWHHQGTDLVGDYELFEVIGEGTFSKVCRALDRRTGRTVTLKELRHMNPDHMLKELTIIQKLQHRNIITLVDYVRKDGSAGNFRIWLVMEYMTLDLSAYLVQWPRPAINEIRTIMKQLFSAVEYIHEHRIMHRDMKPQNILINRENLLTKVCDFGMATPVPISEELMLTNNVTSRWYRSPEMLLQSRYGCPVDMWSLGCILAELSLGKPLFPGASDKEQLSVVLNIMAPVASSVLRTSCVWESLDIPDKILTGKYESNLKAHLEHAARQLYRDNIMDSTTVDLIQRCLCLNQDGRIMAITAGNHRFFGSWRIDPALLQIEASDMSQHGVKASSFDIEGARSSAFGCEGLDDRSSRNAAIRSVLEDMTSTKHMTRDEIEAKLHICCKKTVNLLSENHDLRSHVPRLLDSEAGSHSLAKKALRGVCDSGVYRMQHAFAEVEREKREVEKEKGEAREILREAKRLRTGGDKMNATHENQPPVDTHHQHQENYTESLYQHPQPPSTWQHQPMYNNTSSYSQDVSHHQQEVFYNQQLCNNNVVPDLHPQHFLPQPPPSSYQPSYNVPSSYSQELFYTQQVPHLHYQQVPDLQHHQYHSNQQQQEWLYNHQGSDLHHQQVPDLQHQQYHSTQQQQEWTSGVYNDPHFYSHEHTQGAFMYNQAPEYNVTPHKKNNHPRSRNLWAKWGPKYR